MVDEVTDTLDVSDGAGLTLSLQFLIELHQRALGVHKGNLVHVVKGDLRRVVSRHRLRRLRFACMTISILRVIVILNLHISFKEILFLNEDLLHLLQTLYVFPDLRYLCLLVLNRFLYLHLHLLKSLLILLDYIYLEKVVLLQVI